MSTISNYQPLVGSERTLMPGSHEIGDPDPQEQFQVTVLVRPHPLSPNLSAMAELSDKPLQERKYLSREEFASTYGADTTDLDKVATFAKANQLTVIKSDMATRNVVLTGTAAAFSAAFHTTLKNFEYANGTFRGRKGPVYIPSELAGIIQGVFGLDNRPQGDIHLRISPNESVLNANTGTTLNPLQLSQLYNFPKGVDGTGQAIALIELGGGYNQSDITAYFNFLGLPQPQVKTVSVDGATNNFGSDGTLEVMLDIEVAAAIAPKANIIVYFTPNTFQGFIDAVNAAVHDATNNPSVISISWGLAEIGWTAAGMQALDQVFQSAAALGITVCVASGDNGSPDKVSDGLAHVDFPASSSFALGCGGTSLTAAGSSVLSEVTWNNGVGLISGGGVSNQFSLPAYQAGAHIPKSVNPGGRIGRGVPDVSGHAASYDIIVSGQHVSAAGTSAVAPLWAGLIALLNQQLNTRVGFLNPVLYANPSVLHDITSGNNGAYFSVAGWDACTGLGSPNGASILQLLNPHQWRWSNQGVPAGVKLGAKVGVLTMMDTVTSQQRPYVFIKGSDGNLWVNWWSGSAWSWANEGTPPGVKLGNTMGVVTMRDTPASQQRPYIFIQGSDGNLWVRWWNGSEWGWANEGTPPGVKLGNSMGAITMMDTPTSQQRPYVFIQGSDGNLWVRWWNGSAWGWANEGTPPGVTLGNSMGAITMMDTPASPQRPYIFIQGSDGNLWVRWWNGAAWGWANEGTPPGIQLSSSMGAITMKDSPAAQQRPYVFVRGNDGNLWVRWWNGAAWGWANEGTPPGVKLGNSAGAITMMDTPSSQQRPYVFIEGNDGNLWVRWWNGSAWGWANLATPAGVKLGESIGAITMMDTTSSQQRPYVFVEGNDGNLWVRWWS